LSVSSITASMLIPVTIWACLYLGFIPICFLIFISTCITILGSFNAYNTADISIDYLVFTQLQICVRSFSLLAFGALHNERDMENKRLLLTQNATLLSLASLAETRDNETGQHILRTQEYVGLLAAHLSRLPVSNPVLSAKYIDRIYRSAPLHDIGKVGIPDSILLKPGPLTSDEYEIMKTHTEIGRDALQKTRDLLGQDSFLEIAQIIAFTHHEKWDGSGYPCGLQGEKIPIAGRIMALADVYDALTSRRVYKPPLSHGEACSIIISERGKHFDPAVVDAFIKLESKFKSIGNTMENHPSSGLSSPQRQVFAA